jgi:hypothetical protein
MCTGQFVRMRRANQKLAGLTSGGYEGGGSFVTKAMGLPSARRRSARLPQVPLLGITEEGAI